MIATLVFLWTGAFIKGKANGEEEAIPIHSAGRFMFKALCRTLWYLSWGLFLLNVFTFFLAAIATVLLYLRGFKLEALHLIKLGSLFFLTGFLVAFGGMFVCYLAVPGEGYSLRYKWLSRKRGL